MLLQKRDAFECVRKQGCLRSFIALDTTFFEMKCILNNLKVTAMISVISIAFLEFSLRCFAGFMPLSVSAVIREDAHAQSMTTLKVKCEKKVSVIDLRGPFRKAQPRELNYF